MVAEIITCGRLTCLVCACTGENSCDIHMYLLIGRRLTGKKERGSFVAALFAILQAQDGSSSFSTNRW